jgi:hypothetical protein
MGALMRATRDEIAILSESPDWWPGVLDEVRERGGPQQVVNENVWSYGAFIGWVRGDVDRSAQYDEALRDYAHRAVMETIPIADGATAETASAAKLRIGARQWAAGKWDRKRYGESADQIGVLLDPLSEMLREISERKIAALRAPAEGRVIEATHTVVSETAATAEDEI